MKAGRDLLIGLNAVEQDLITRAQLSEAFHAWNGEDMESSFGGFLCQRGLIDASDRERLEALVDQQLVDGQEAVRSAVWRALMQAANENDDGFSSASLHQSMNAIVSATESSDPTREYEPHMGETFSPESFDAIDVMQDVKLSTSSSGSSNDISATSRSRYSRTRVHSQGGLGRVWLARDQALNREVALKEIRRDRGVTSEKIRRFMREAQITGQLEHPNIIPVYELAAEGTEGPFYTMKFMRGETLTKRIISFHKSHAAGEWSGLGLTQLLTAFVGICHAVGYAHSRGVIHRDLKPDNVMIGAFGEVIVLDWGLAKTVDESADTIDEEETPETVVEVVGEAAIDRTEYGQVVGTPSYMAPEQAAGSVHLMGPSTDIYGLGAILFAILSSHAPHRTEGESTPRSTRNLLTQISSGPTPSIRSIEPTLPKALDAICQKAMARVPENRYASAIDLADDVQRWLADEPVSVHRSPLREQIMRWMRRHKAWTMASAAALLVISVVSTSAAFVVSQARDDAIVARGEAEEALVKEQTALAAETEARQEAMRMLRKAREAVDRSFTGVSLVLKNFPGMQWLRIELLKQSASDYESFAREKGTLPELRLETARAYTRLGDVQNLMGDAQAAESAYRTAERNYRELAPLLPDVVDVRLELAATLSTLGSIYTTRNEFPGAKDKFEAAIAVMSEITDANEQSRVTAARAAVLLNSASLLLKNAKLAAAEQHLSQAKAAFQSLNDSGDGGEHVEGLAAALARIGKLKIEMSQFNEAIVELQAGADAYLKLWQGAEELRFLEGLALCLIDRGNAFKYLGQNAAAIRQYAEAVKHFNTLLDARPGVPYYREMIAVLGLNAAQIRTREGRNANAKELAESAFGTFDELVLATENDLAVPQYLLERATASATLAAIYRDLQVRDGDGLELAQVLFDRAVEDFSKLSDRFPTVVDYRRRLAGVLTDAAHGLVASSDAATRDEGRQNFVRAIAMLDAIVDQDPLDQTAKDKLATACLYFADSLTRANAQSPEAATYYTRASALRSDLQATSEHLERHAWLLARCRNPKFRNPQTAIASAKKACAQSPDNPRFHCTLALAHFAAGEWKSSIETFGMAKDLRDPKFPHPLELFGLSMAYCQDGQRELALKTLDQAKQLTAQVAPGNLELVAMQREAMELLESNKP